MKNKIYLKRGNKIVVLCDKFEDSMINYHIVCLISSLFSSVGIRNYIQGDSDGNEKIEIEYKEK